MKELQVAAVQHYRKEIVAKISPEGTLEIFLSYLHRENAIGPDTRSFLEKKMNFVTDTIHKTLDVLISNDSGWDGLIGFLNANGGTELVKKLKAKAGETAPTGIEASEAKGSFKLDAGVTAASKGSKYKNTRKGLAMLINIEKFPDPAHKRDGSRKDLAQSVDLWESLGYRVVRHADLTGNEIKQAAIAFAKDVNHANADSAVVVLMSHGNLEEIEGSDGVMINIQQFVNTICGSSLLNEKPKLFLFQACRDEIVAHDGPDSAQLDVTEEMIQSRFSWFKLHHDGIEDTSHADSILGFAASRGEKAYRTDHGSFYIQEICNTFGSDHSTSHVIQLLETVIIQQLTLNKLVGLLATRGRY